MCVASIDKEAWVLQGQVILEKMQCIPITNICLLSELDSLYIDRFVFDAKCFSQYRTPAYRQRSTL